MRKSYFRSYQSRTVKREISHMYVVAVLHAYVVEGEATTSVRLYHAISLLIRCTDLFSRNFYIYIYNI